MSNTFLEHVVPYVPIWLLKVIYPLKESNRVRDRPMKVLCLGLGRTGTESLRTALKDLGYNESYHGFYLISEAVPDLIQWDRLGRAKMGPDPREDFLTREQFDKVLGNSMALMDTPAVFFAVELLRAYPEAKVILNRRNDLEAWHQSQLKTLNTMYTDWPSWTRQWFEAEAFWIVRIAYWMKCMVGFDFARNGKSYYREHYAQLEAELRRQKREWLDWTVEDGWQPLCQFLGDSVPEKAFPQGNAGGGQFQATRARLHHGRIVRGNRNMKIAGAMSVGFIVGAIWWFSTR